MKSPAFWVVLYALLVIGLSSIPGKAFPDIRLLHYDKLIHLVEYAILGFLLSRALALRVTSGRGIITVALLIAGAFGALDETYQLLIPGRDFSYGDWVADILGILAGGSLFLLRRSQGDQTPVH